MTVFVRICWIITALATCIAALDLLNGLNTANGAPQQAAVAAMAAAMVIIPYIFTRAVEGMSASAPPSPSESPDLTVIKPRRAVVLSD